MGSWKDMSRVNKRGFATVFFSIVLTIVPVYIFNRVHFMSYPEAVFYSKGNKLLVLIYAALLIVLVTVYGGYRIRQYRTRELAFSFAIAIIIENTFIFFVMSLIASKILAVWPLVRMTILQMLLAVVIYMLARMLLPLLEPAIPTLFIRSEDDWDNEIPRKFDDRRTSYQVKDSFSASRPLEEILLAIEPYPAVLIGDISHETRQSLISYCYRTGRRVLLTPGMTDVLVGSASSIIMGDCMLYDLNAQGQDLPYLTAKRAFDIIASALGLIILSPLLIATALAVKLYDHGPVFYRQVRLTQGGRPFLLAKFRSMVVNAEKHTGAVLAGKTDSRITPVGKIIRAARIDELPQLWNILIGDMTFVGPRPERPEFYEKILKEYPKFDFRLKVKAGLTGYAQLYGKYNTTFADKARLDIYYIQNASLLLDLKLLFYTIKIIFMKESTEGVAAPGSETAPPSVQEAAAAAAAEVPVETETENKDV